MAKTIVFNSPTAYIMRDGQRVAEVENNEFKILAWFHKNVSYSMDHAITHEGYSVVEVPERFAVYVEKVGEKPEFQKAYATMRGAERVGLRLFDKLTREPHVVGLNVEWRREQYTTDLGWFSS